RVALVLSIVRGETSVAEAAPKHGLTVAEIEESQERFSPRPRMRCGRSRQPVSSDSARCAPTVPHLSCAVTRQIGAMKGLFREGLQNAPISRTFAEFLLPAAELDGTRPEAGGAAARRRIRWRRRVARRRRGKRSVRVPARAACRGAPRRGRN